MAEYDNRAVVAFRFRGLYVTAGATYDRREVWDREIFSILMDDPQEFFSWAILDISESVERILRNFFKDRTKIFPSLEARILSAWEDDIRERIAKKI